MAMNAAPEATERTSLLKVAVDYYHELLGDEKLAAESFKALHDGLEHKRLIFGGRPLSPYLRPHFITETDWLRVKGVCETIWGALQKVKDEAIRDGTLLDELGFSETEKDLVRIDPGYRQVSPTARLDSFLTDAAYSFVELNGESPAGIAYADSATEIFLELPVMQKFAERYSVSGFSGSPRLLEVLENCWREFCGGKAERDPVIAIVDLKDLPTQKEFELFRDYFASKGLDAVICSPQDLEFADGRLYYGSLKIDVVYKRLLVNEYLPIIDECPALLDAYRAGAICMVNSFRGKLVHKKAIFAILSNERYSHLFDEAELAAIEAHIPWTRKFREERTQIRDAPGKDHIEVDLVEWARANSQKLVLKPNDDYGGHGIFIGWSLNAGEWDDAIETALVDGDYLVQERVRTARETFPMVFDEIGSWGMVEQLVDLDPLLFNGIVGSAFTRLSSNELANVTAGGGMVPTFVIADR
ncbi:MAG: hypothetical protein IPM25_06215 [Chloracidobacterium sp.]|nr:hypothetical protein [Chloracidobacterium sp.]